MSDHPEFGIGRNSAPRTPGLMVWRIENMKPVLLKPADHGKLFKGDAYIILHTKKNPQNPDQLLRDIHFWLGSECTKDEAGAAALKTVELDDILGGDPVQYREVENHESQQFLSLFKGGVQYMQGGVASAFKTVDRDAFRKRLLHVKGKKAVRVKEVPISCDSLNTGDVFILDCGMTIYQWNGPESNRMEKSKGVDVALNIRNNERGAKAKIVVVEGEEVEEAFFKELGGKGVIKDAASAGSDEEFEKKSGEKLYHVSDASGKLVIKPLDGPIKKEQLDTNDCFILDCQTEIYAWIGKLSTPEEKKSAFEKAQHFVIDNKYPEWTQVVRVVEGAETPMFKSHFVSWPSMVVPAVSSASTPAKPKKDEVSGAAAASSMLKSKPSPIVQGPDDGNGNLTMYVVRDYKLVKLHPDSHGELWSGDCYVCKYGYSGKGREEFLVYFWQGRDAKTEDKGASSLLAVQISDENNKAPQIRVVQGKEPIHFAKMFKGKMIIHKGTMPNGWIEYKNPDQLRGYSTEGLYRVRISGQRITCRAIQVDATASNLNSNDSFILVTTNKQYLWYGKGSDSTERSAAEALAFKLKQTRPAAIVCEEGKEPADFWTALGGKKQYANDPTLVDETRDPRLFQCSNASGQYKVEEIFNFDQDDLDESDVFLLDVYSSVFVWVGVKSNDEEKKKSLETALEYVKNSTDGRDKDCPILVVNQGSEPIMFIASFSDWDQSKTKEDPYTRKLKEAKAVVANYDKTWSYEELKKKPAEVPPGKLDEYLNVDEYPKVFKLKRDEYMALPTWKRTKMKQDAGLY